MKVLVVDNFDSFVYNLVHYLEGMDVDVTVARNSDDILAIAKNFDKILLSPGPGLPKGAGKMMELINNEKERKSILGVCLGHQALGEYFGLRLKNLATVYHGVASELLQIKESRLFKDIPDKIKVGRYHSWVIDKNSVHENIEVLATDNNGEIMAIQHKEFPLFGVQFHPESILTEYGKDILLNWIND